MAGEAKAATREYLDQQAAKAGTGTENPATPPKVTRVSWICLAIGLVGVLGGGACFVMTEVLHYGDSLNSAGTIAVIVGFLFLTKPLHDASKPSPASRPDPAKALAA